MWFRLNHRKLLVLDHLENRPCQRFSLIQAVGRCEDRAGPTSHGSPHRGSVSSAPRAPAGAGRAWKAVPFRYGRSGLGQAQVPSSMGPVIVTHAISDVSAWCVVCGHAHPRWHPHPPVNVPVTPAQVALLLPMAPFLLLLCLSFCARICLNHCWNIFSILSLFYKNWWKTKLECCPWCVCYHKHNKRENVGGDDEVYWRQRISSPPQPHVHCPRVVGSG